MWDSPGPGLEPVSPAWAGGILTTAPPGKSPDYLSFYLMFFFSSKIPPRTSHDISLSCHLGLLLAATVSQIFLVFDNLDSYEEDWSGIFVDRSLIWHIATFYFSHPDTYIVISHCGLNLYFANC